MMCVDLTKMMVLEELEKMRQDLGFYTQQAVRTAENERQCWRFSSDEQAQVRRTLLLPEQAAMPMMPAITRGCCQMKITKHVLLSHTLEKSLHNSFADNLI